MPGKALLHRLKRFEKALQSTTVSIFSDRAALVNATAINNQGKESK
jgi:hypothetical protein